MKRMARRSRKKDVYAFIDSQNLNVSVQKLGWKIDWHKFRKFLADKYGVTKAFMFIGYVPEFEDMYVQLHDTGYAIVLKQTFDMTRPQPELLEDSELKELKIEPQKESEEDKKVVKGNVDADLVLWAMKEIDNYHQAVIVSGDGDFFSLIEYLESKNKLLKVLAPTGSYSSLFNKYDNYVERLDTHRKELSYRNGKTKRSSGNKRQSK